jgi:hypothetical protein
MKQSLLIALLASILISTSAQAQSTDRSAILATDAIPIIDAHTHTIFTGEVERGRGIPQTETQYFKEWREAGVVGAVAHTSTSGGNFYDLKDRNVIYCAGIGADTKSTLVETGLRSGKYGCIKIYLGYVHQYAYDKRYEPYYQLARKYDVPVVFHTGDTDSAKAKLKYADPLTIDEVAVDHPQVRFVIAHCGNPWIESAAEVTYKNPNVYMECSALLTGNLDEMPKEKVETYVVRPIAWIFGYIEDPSKLMFGTDWPLTAMKPYVEAYRRAIPKEHWRAVFHDNAVRVFKFPARHEPQGARLRSRAVPH